MALEDFTDYTDYSPSNSYTTLDANTSEVDGWNQNDDASLYDDKGAGFFGNFTHNLEVTYDDDADEDFNYAGCWALSNSAEATWNTMDVAGAGLSVSLRRISASLDPIIRLYDMADSANPDTSIDLAPATKYYLTIQRTDSEIQCFIYDDSERTSLVDTLSVAHVATTFRYIVATHTMETGSANEADWTVENLDLGAEEVSSVPILKFLG